MQKTVDIFGVPFSKLNKNELQTVIKNALKNKEKLYLAFANPEYILNLNSSFWLREYLKRANYILPDGQGILWASKKLHPKENWLRQRVTGTDFTFDLLKTLEETGKKIYVLGGSFEVNKMALERAKKLYPKLKISGRDGYFEEEETEQIIKKINQSKADVLMVCMGNPKQEEWLFRNADRIKTKIQFGNGGAVDFLAGNIKRAPEKWQNLGLEWLWRLTQDFTLKRITRQTRLFWFVNMVFMASLLEKNK